MSEHNKDNDKQLWSWSDIFNRSSYKKCAIGALYVATAIIVYKNRKNLHPESVYMMCAMTTTIALVVASEPKNRYQY